MEGTIRKMRVASRITAVLLIVLMIVTAFTPEAMASSGKTKKMTVYTQVIVKGNYAYCIARLGLYKVNLKTGHKKRLVKNMMPEVDSGSVVTIKLHRGYLYYEAAGALCDNGLCRIKTSGKKDKYLGDVYNYAIKKNRIFYTTYGASDSVKKKKQMSLNGKHKRKSKFKVKNKYRKSNKKGYYVETVLLDETEDYDFDMDEWVIKEYYQYNLVMPGGRRIFLCSFTDQHFE